MGTIKWEKQTILIESSAFCLLLIVAVFQLVVQATKEIGRLLLGLFRLCFAAVLGFHAINGSLLGGTFSVLFLFFVGLHILFILLRMTCPVDAIVGEATNQQNTNNNLAIKKEIINTFHKRLRYLSFYLVEQYTLKQKYMQVNFP